MEQSQAVRNVQAQFNSLQEQLYGRVHDLRTLLDQRLTTLESGFTAHQQATEQLIRGLHDQFQAHFYQNHTAGMQTLRVMLEQLLADRNQATTPAASPSPAPTAHSILGSAPQPPEADLLNLGAPTVALGATSGTHNPAESRTFIIPTHSAPSGYRTPRLSRAMPPHNSWAAPPYQDPP